MFIRFLVRAWLVLAAAVPGFAVPMAVTAVSGTHGMVVAGHPQAAAAGLTVLKAGGNAVDAAIATSLALGVAEPYASGLGGKLMLLYYNAASRHTFVIDAMDAAGSLDAKSYVSRPESDRSYGYGSVCVPGLAAGLWLAHQKWGARPWSTDVQPSIDLARNGFDVLPKSRDFFEEQTKKLHRGDAEIARLFLPHGEIPETGSVLPNPDLARTLAVFAEHGRDGFYRGDIAERIVRAAQAGGGVITAEDLSSYEARVTEPVEIEFRGYRIASAPPPSNGSAMFLTALKVLEDESFGNALRSPENLDAIGHVWREVEPEAYRVIGDGSGARFAFEKMVAADSIRALRAKAFGTPRQKAAASEWDQAQAESVTAATTHFIVADSKGNIVCATQSLSVHFGAGVVPPGTGIVLNDSMSNFEYRDPTHPNYVAAGRRPRSTISPTLVFRDGRPVLALGVPGAARIPTSMLQVLLDRLALNRPLADAIGDVRFHYSIPWKPGEVDIFETETPFPSSDAEAMTARGWKVVLAEEAGRGRKFSGVNAVEFGAYGTFLGYADPRRTNTAAGY
jgi:gamma-glutamyltranspeptidase/glutathione hydrolase